MSKGFETAQSVHAPVRRWLAAIALLACLVASPAGGAGREASVLDFPHNGPDLRLLVR
jgi:hypothetical protein